MYGKRKQLLLLFVSKLNLLNLHYIRKKRRKRLWVRKLWISREKSGHYLSLISEMILHDHEMYFNYFRMLPATFDTLLNLIGPKIQRKDTNFRKALPASLKLAVALRYLATGESQKSLSFNYRIGHSTVTSILKEVPQKIFEVLGPLSLQLPQNEERWKGLARDFWEIWNFPLCLGAIDGKHCVITCPANSGSSYYNYKGTFNIVLMAIADASYMFTYVDVGDYDRQGDSGVFNNSEFGKAIVANTLNIPQKGVLPNTNIEARYCFIGDEAFPLKENIQRPYPGKMLLEHKRIYNYRLSRARRVVENAFGILGSRWRFLRSPINATPEKVTSYVLGAISLHNWLKKLNDQKTAYGSKRYCPQAYVDYEDAHGI